MRPVFYMSEGYAEGGSWNAEGVSLTLFASRVQGTVWGESEEHRVRRHWSES